MGEAEVARRQSGSHLDATTVPLTTGNHLTLRLAANKTLLLPSKWKLFFLLKMRRRLWVCFLQLIFQLLISWRFAGKWALGFDDSDVSRTRWCLSLRAQDLIGSDWTAAAANYIRIREHSTVSTSSDEEIGWKREKRDKPPDKFKLNIQMSRSIFDFELWWI